MPGLGRLDRSLARVSGGCRAVHLHSRRSAIRSPFVNAVIISIGDELVTGQQVDSNSAWLSRQLAAVGIATRAHHTVGDDRPAVAAVVRGAFSDGELIILTGGLGPTADDLTREGVAEALGLGLHESSEALRQIQGFFDRWQRQMSESNRRQALLPTGADLLPNSCGTAPGFRCRVGQARLYALPGVPSEMRAMFESHVAPQLAAAGQSACIRFARLSCFGISEAKLGEILADLMARGRNPSVGTTASNALLGVRIVARGADALSADALLNQDAAEIRRRLGHLVFGAGDESLESTVAALLIEQGKTVAAAESCTGGLLARRLTDIPGSSAYFLRGYVAYSNQAKVELLGVDPDLIVRHGAVSEEVARAMAVGCRSAGGVDFALAITGIAGPTWHPRKDRSAWCTSPGWRRGCPSSTVPDGRTPSRVEIRDRAAKWALNMLRLRLLDHVSDEHRT